MATPNNLDSPLTAELRSSDGRYSLVFNLFRLEDERHADWHGYAIQAHDRETGEAASLHPEADGPLFLDRAIEPEVPMLAEGLRSVAETGGHFVMEPIDDRDFRLEADGGPEGVRVRLKFDGARRQPPGWVSGVVVRHDDLVEFSGALGRAFESLAP